jgi:hypothetical protein
MGQLQAEITFVGQPNRSIRCEGCAYLAKQESKSGCGTRRLDNSACLSGLACARRGGVLGGGVDIRLAGL